MSSKDFISRQAIDYFHHAIGSYYDIRRDHFLLRSCLKTTAVLNDNIVDKPPCSSTFYEHSFRDTMTEKFQKIKIDSSLSASVLADLAKPNGSFKFLTESPETSQIVKGSIFYREAVRTDQLKETVLNNNKQLKELITFEGQPCEATHIVIGIIYGFCVNANFERRVEKHEKKYEVEGKLKLMLTEIKAISSGSVGVDAEYHQTSKADTNSFSVKIYANFNFADQLPQTAEETLAFFKKLPEFTKKDVSLAKPIEYILYPINNLKRQLKVSINGLDNRDVSEGTLFQIQSNADYLLEKQQKYNDYYKVYLSVSARISESAHKKTKERKDQLMAANLMYRKKLGENLVKVRSSTMEENEFLKQTNTSFDELVHMYEQSYLQKEKIDFLRLVLDQDCLLIDKCTTADLIPDEYGQSEKKLFLGIINDHLITSDDASWKLFVKKFIDIMNSEGKQAKYILRNDDLGPMESSSISSIKFRIMHYCDRKLIKNEIVDIKDNLPGTAWYCNRCGAEDNEERFLALKSDEINRTVPNNDDADRIMNYGKVIVCEKKDRFNPVLSDG
jgi:hypothetical protein